MVELRQLYQHILQTRIFIYNRTDPRRRNLSPIPKLFNTRRTEKIDIGAIYSQPPKDKIIIQSGKITADARELVFDIDMDDYDSVRKCGCSGANICPICWGFMKMAVKVMDKGLREDFGFQHIAWFYSGRRGVHAWVCDDEALYLTDEARGAITKYFQVCSNDSYLALTFFGWSA
jgi:DNA primase small subunit